MTSTQDSSSDLLESSLDSVGRLLAGLQPAQLEFPTPCEEWNVRHVVNHVIGMNRVFAAMLQDEPLPERVQIDDIDLPSAYADSSRILAGCFREPGMLDRVFAGPLGSSTGHDRLWIRMYDLMAHGWDVARATDQRVDIADDVVERVLIFAQGQVDTMPREGRFHPPQPVPETAPPIDRLAAFLGRDPLWRPADG